MACRRSGVQIPLAPPGQRLAETGSRSSGSKTGSKPLAILVVVGGHTAGARRRGHNEGSIYKDEAKDRWYGAVSLGYGPDEKTWRRMAAHDAETTLARALDGHYARVGEEPYALCGAPSRAFAFVVAVTVLSTLARHAVYACSAR
jgi:hypothetical protein